MLAGVTGLVAMWRNVTNVVAPVADANNAILPLWLILWGVALLRADGGTTSNTTTTPSSNSVPKSRYVLGKGPPRGCLDGQTATRHLSS